MDMTVASTTAITAARQPSRLAVTAAPAASSTSGRQPATDVVDLRADSGAAGSGAADSGVIVRVKVGGSVQTYTYASFA